jgi:hypothetical protein
MAHLPQVAELFASAARATAAVNTLGTAAADLAAAKRAIVTLDVTAAATAAGDKLDVYVDLEVAPSKWVNAVHFTQVLGNGGAKTFVAVLDPSSPGTSVLDASADCSAGDVKPAVWGLSMRGRYTIVDGGAHGQSFTFSLEAVLQ